MNRKIIIPAIAATFALSSASFAAAQQTSTAGSIGTGVAAATKDGAVAGGMVAGQATTKSNPGRDRQDRDNRRDRRDRRDETPTSSLPSSTSTFGSGAINTTRDSASAGVTSGANASGSGAVSAGTTVDAYGETTRSGSSADIFGDSAATAGQTPAR